MKSYWLQQMPFFAALAGSIGIHVGFFVWSTGATQIDPPPLPKSGPCAISVRFSSPSAPEMASEILKELESVDALAAPVAGYESVSKVANDRMASPPTASGVVPQGVVPQGLKLPGPRRRQGTAHVQRAKDEKVDRKIASSTAVAAINAKPVQQSRGAIAPPVVISNPEPDYPKELQRRRIGGAVTFDFVINEMGRAEQIRTSKSSGISALDRSALTTLRKWRFHPARRKGRAVKQAARHTFRFKPPPIR